MQESHVRQPRDIMDFVVTLVNSNFYLPNKQEEILPAGPTRMTFQRKKSEEKVKRHYTVVNALVYRACLNSKPEVFKIFFAL